MPNLISRETIQRSPIVLAKTGPSRPSWACGLGMSYRRRRERAPAARSSHRVGQGGQVARRAGRNQHAGTSVPTAGGGGCRPSESSVRRRTGLTPGDGPTSSRSEAPEGRSEEGHEEEMAQTEAEGRRTGRAAHRQNSPCQPFPRAPSGREVDPHHCRTACTTVQPRSTCQLPTLQRCAHGMKPPRPLPCPGLGTRHCPPESDHSRSLL